MIRSLASRPSLALVAALALGALVAAPATASTGGAPAGAQHVPGEVLVSRSGGARPSAGDPEPQVVKVGAHESMAQALSRLRREPGVDYAVPNMIAHAAGFVPDDRGRAHRRGGWQRLQWNFAAAAGVNAPDAWQNLRRAHHAGGKGVTVAVLDTGVAYRNRGRFRRSPDLRRTRFVRGHDFIDHDSLPLDRNGHGTHVASTIAESTDNGRGLTGLAYGVRIMPVRVLDRFGNGDALTISRGIRWAVRHHARVINLSLEFSHSVRAAQIPDILAAVRFARRHGVVIVAAAGNEGVGGLAYPARDSKVISVTGTTSHLCLADYSNKGQRLSLVAPGGGDDASVPGDANCRPGRHGRPIYQVTMRGSVRRFGIVGMEGTSMATPHVSAAAALVIASRVIGRRPSPSAVEQRLEQTARDLGPPGHDRYYGWGLVDAAAATTPATAAERRRSHRSQSRRSRTR